MKKTVAVHWIDPISSVAKSMVIPDAEFDKILTMAISALNRLDDRSPMENRALSFALRLESR